MSVCKDDVYWLRKAVQLANNREGHTIVDDHLPKIGAILVDGRHQVGCGVNLRKSHPLQEQWGNNSHAIFLHAEIATIIDAIRKDSRIEFKDTTMYIGRSKKYLEPRKRRGVTTLNGWGLSKPCPGCTDALEHYGMKRVVYTDDAIQDEKWQEISF